ncbi:MAG: hypothetical protein IPK82_29940 [Polyangiaceae bacterium]|nr:hypothetical protein [Polyangiaceae bacterium]
MIPPVDVATLSAPAQKILAPATPAKLREMAARGIAPGVKPAEALTIVALLAHSNEPSVRDTAEKTLSALPEPLLKAALDADLPTATIHSVATHLREHAEAISKLLKMPQIAIETVEEVARIGSEAVTEVVATNEERLLKHPRLVELLYFNKHTRASTVDRLIELMTRHNIELRGIPAWKEVAQSIQGELIAEPSDEPLPDDLLFKETAELAERLAREAAEEEDTHHENDEGEESLKDKFKPLYQQLSNMSVGQRIRRAQMGTREERMLLVRDANRIVATSAIRSPLMQDNEVQLLSRNRNLSEDVLRVIATTPEWLKSYSIKRNLVENPKTPVMLAMRMVEQLREADLRKIARSKNVSGPVQEAARRHLNRRSS